MGRRSRGFNPRTCLAHWSLPREIFSRCGTRRVFRASSRPVPNFSGGRGETRFPQFGEFFEPICCAIEPLLLARRAEIGRELGLNQSIQEESQAPKFYRIVGDFTRRFWAPISYIAHLFSCSYGPGSRHPEADFQTSAGPPYRAIFHNQNFRNLPYDFESDCQEIPCL